VSLAGRIAELQPAPVRILTLDIETSPAVAYIWGLRDQNVSTQQIVEPSRVLCWAGKWLGQSRVHFYSEHHHSRAEMVEAAWTALDQADMVIGYNHVRFDIPHLQREFVLAGYAPPSPWHDVDLLKVMRSRFRFLSNKLGYVVAELGLDHKADSGGMDTWRKVLAGHGPTWETFKQYNKTDVEVTEALFTYLRPWLKLPHAGLWNGDLAACHACGGTDLVPDGIVRTKTTAYLRLRCPCGALNRQLTNGQTRQA
jgi:DNA polymerase elongation subunit (family B)